MIAAPVLLTKEKIRKRSAQAIIVNSGNANACTGAEGLDHARSVCCAVADELNIPEQFVLMSSTGIIGVPLPVEKNKYKDQELSEHIVTSRDTQFCRSYYDYRYLPQSGPCGRSSLTKKKSPSAG